MNYRVEIHDLAGRRIAGFGEVPLMEATRTGPDRADTIIGMLPLSLGELSHGYRVTVLVDGEVFCEGLVRWVAPQWGDTRKLILDRYVTFQEVLEFGAERPACDGNARVVGAYANRAVSDVVKRAINSTLGRVHYLVAHGSYPEGARREHAKFLARKTAGNELETGGVSSGQWVGADRMDASGAYAKDGDTIAGLVVDGVAWPDVRLMMIDCEECERNSHAVKRHPEVADWTYERYALSGYAFKAEEAKRALQEFIDEKGIEYIELNPHRGSDGSYDDRVDVYGRYIGMAHGGGECFSAGLVEKGLGDVYLYKDGKYHVPEMELKDFFSYALRCNDSIEDASTSLTMLDVDQDLFELLTALSYAAGGYVWSLDVAGAVSFRKADMPDRVIAYEPVELGVGLGSDVGDLVNTVYFEGNQLSGPVEKTYVRRASLDEYGYRGKGLALYAVATEADADLLVEGLLDDVAYPESMGALQFLRGDGRIRVGDIVELRGGCLRRLEHETDGEWGDLFRGKHVRRVKDVAHRFCGSRVTTVVGLTSPLRSVEDPLSFMARGQGAGTGLFQFRLDSVGVGLDLGYHLD